ncbi:MAG: bifunctional 3-demethylubiquinol 3-O-methyltransferase/2-polyprenyl-6-hydroxyphenol methylase, partial [Caulobacterales bacterium]|nr:bifunctional 3-demethylubiquinol 3-O-methyltransferase/2-polyprenyl-6-hydroxyphenol methylase [Caulobacterales bacterium]
ALAIVGAEYVLGWLPRGTHEYAKLVKPAEARAALEAAGLSVAAPVGMTYRPLSGRWDATGDASVNYMLAARRAPGGAD